MQLVSGKTSPRGRGLVSRTQYGPRRSRPGAVILSRGEHRISEGEGQESSAGIMLTRTVNSGQIR